MPIPDEPARLARAAAALPPHHPELPAAVDHALFLRGSARRKAGGLDAASYASSYVALIDLSLRMAGLGWRNVLCETAFVARRGEGKPLGDDVETLGVRWPTWHARLAQFLMNDPLDALRTALTDACRNTSVDSAALRTQPDLFAAVDAAGGDEGEAAT
jgi:hypothetical protein